MVKGKTLSQRERVAADRPGEGHHGASIASTVELPRATAKISTIEAPHPAAAQPPSPSGRGSAPREKERLRLWIRLLRASRTIEAELREQLKAGFGTTLPRFDVMAALDRAPDGMVMSDLSRFLLVSNGNVTGIVDRLVADGLVARATRNGDRRTSMVRLTEAGRTGFAAMAAAHATWIDDLLGDIGKADARALSAVLRSFRSNWEMR